MLLSTSLNTALYNCVFYTIQATNFADNSLNCQGRHMIILIIVITKFIFKQKRAKKPYLVILKSYSGTSNSIKTTGYSRFYRIIICSTASPLMSVCMYCIQKDCGLASIGLVRSFKLDLWQFRNSWYNKGEGNI